MVRLASRNGRHHTVPADIGNKRHSELLKPGPDEGGSLPLVECQLRIGVQVLAPGGQGLVERLIHSRGATGFRSRRQLPQLHPTGLIDTLAKARVQRWVRHNEAAMRI
jgi:hypothetical protein